MPTGVRHDPVHEPVHAKAAGTQSTLVQEANHRIANQLSQLAAQVQAQLRTLERRGDSIPKAEVLFLLRGVAARVVGFSRHHRQLAEQDQDEPLELGEFLIETCGTMLAQLGLTERVRFVYRLGGGCAVAPAAAHGLALALCEIVMNAVKYAHPAGLPVLMTVRCERLGGRLTVEFADDGVGLPDGFDPQADGGTGFRIIRALAEQIGAGLGIESDCLGLTFRFVLPAPAGSGAATGSQAPARA